MEWHSTKREFVGEMEVEESPLIVCLYKFIFRRVYMYVAAHNVNQMLGTNLNTRTHIEQKEKPSNTIHIIFYAFFPPSLAI